MDPGMRRDNEEDLKQFELGCDFPWRCEGFCIEFVSR